MTLGGRARAYLELARLSNAPTVVSNAFCGVILALGGAPPSSPWRVFIPVAGGCVLLYAAGMILNDAVDARIDARERPGRPIPSGRVKRSTAFGLAATALLIGVGVLCTAGERAAVTAAALAACIVLYNLFHASSPASVTLLGACRGLVYAAAFVAVWRGSAPGAPLWVVVGGVAVYTAAFSLIARSEAGPSASWTRAAAWLIPVATVGVIAGIRPNLTVWLLVCVIALLAWQVYAASLWSRTPNKPVAAVCAWIAGLCLIDAVVVAGIGPSWRVAIPGLCFVATLAGQRRILGS